MPEQNVFQKIIAGEIPADIIHEDQQCLAFHDIAPQAPTHILIIPRKLIRSVADLEDEDGQLIAHLWMVIRKLADQLGLENGYRVVVNCGRDGGQEVEHLHYHLLGGRALEWHSPHSRARVPAECGTARRVLRGQRTHTIHRRPDRHPSAVLQQPGFGYCRCWTQLPRRRA